MADKGAITVVTKRPPLAPPAAAGGLLGAELGLIVGTLSQSYIPIAVILVPTLLGAGITALAAYAIQQRRGSLRRLNRDLLQISSMSERGLIDGDEFHRLKTRIIDDYQPQRVVASRIVKPALWGALVSGFVVSLVIAAGYLPLNGFLMGLFGTSTGDDHCPPAPSARPTGRTPLRRANGLAGIGHTPPAATQGIAQPHASLILPNLT
jgi:hypothetical protein